MTRVYSRIRRPLFPGFPGYFFLCTLLFVGLVSAGCASTSTSGKQGSSTPSINTAQAQQPTPAAPTSPPATSTVPPETSTPEVLPTPSETVPEPIVPAAITSLPDPVGFAWREYASGLQEPVSIASPGDGSDKLFVVEQPGRIRLLLGNQLVPEPFLDITGRVGSERNEQGLLGLAFHPRHAENGFFYINYTDQNGDTVIARFNHSGDPNAADPDSEMVLLRLPQPFANHNGGAVEFGPDGYLYLGLGDGGSGGDPNNNGQSVNILLGKLLRIDVDGGETYAIPADNPFAAGGGRSEIWAYGLRNPWRISFDRATGDLYIADVGQNEWEEINFQPAGNPGGNNYGWALKEGTHPFRDADASGVALVDPVAEYSHNEGGCSVTGGVVYRGAALPEWQGVYLYGDYCTGNIWGLLRTGETWTSSLLFQTGFRISTFGEDDAGEVYLADHSGIIYRLEK